MSNRFTVSVEYMDFGREVEIRVLDAQNPSRTMTMRVAEMSIPDVEEMLQSILDKLAEAKGKRQDADSIKRLLTAFQEGANERGGQADPSA